MKKRLKDIIIGGSMITILFIGYKISESERIPFCIKHCESDKALTFGGVVIQTFFGDNNKGKKTLRIVQNGLDTIDYYSGWRLDLNFVEPGDSIHKFRGEFRFEIFREKHLYKTIEGYEQDCQLICD